MNILRVQTNYFFILFWEALRNPFLRDFPKMVSSRPYALRTRTSTWETSQLTLLRLLLWLFLIVSAPTVSKRKVKGPVPLLSSCSILPILLILNISLLRVFSTQLNPLCTMRSVREVEQMEKSYLSWYPST